MATPVPVKPTPSRQRQASATGTPSGTAVGATVIPTSTPPTPGPSTGPFIPPQMPPQVGTPPPPNISATIDPQLQALSGDWRQYVTDLREGTGHAMDVLATKTRDAREGGLSALRTRNVIAGRPEAAGASDYEADTQRGVQSTLADVAIGREAMRGQALTGAVAAARAPLDMALAEKGLGLSAYQAHQNAVLGANSMNANNYNTAFNQMMALLEARRSSPAAADVASGVVSPPRGRSYGDSFTGFGR